MELERSVVGADSRSLMGVSPRMTAWVREITERRGVLESIVMDVVVFDHKKLVMMHSLLLRP